MPLLRGLLVSALLGAQKGTLEPDHRPAEGTWDASPLTGRIAAVAAGSFKHREPPEVRGTGYVVETLEAALWAFHRSTSFRKGALLAVNLGDDADTAGAIYGQVAGAYYGADGIPQLMARTGSHGNGDRFVRRTTARAGWRFVAVVRAVYWPSKVDCPQGQNDRSGP